MLNVLAGDNVQLAEILSMVKVEYENGIGIRGPILIDGSAKVDVQTLKVALDQGRTLWLHGFSPDTFSKIAALLPSDAMLKPIPQDLIGTMSVAKDDPLFTGISNYDLAWYIPKMYYGGPIFDDAKVVAKNGDWMLDTNLFASNVRQLTAPALTIKIKSGKGTILFDNLLWENAITQLPEKTTRVVSNILANLGCQFVNERNIAYQFSHVDLSKHANMGYMDRTPDDGQGGWTDQGDNDMRFFLINHSGKGNGRENGMDVPIPDFPTQVEFAGIPVKLVDPKINDEKAVLSFGSSMHASKLMRHVDNIPVNTKADTLWLVHTIGWSEGRAGDVVAHFDVTYDDGSKAQIPIRRFIDVGDWYTPSRYPNAKVAWTGRNLEHSPVGLNLSRWDNPHSDKSIVSISVKAGLSNSQYILLAITCGQIVQ